MKNFLRKINYIFKNIQSNIKIQVLICVTLSVFVIVSFIIINNLLDESDSHEYTIVEDITLINQIEKSSKDNDKISLSGYAFQLEEDSTNSSISLFLRNVNNGKEVWLEAEQIARPDVNYYFNCEYNYENSGFNVEVKEDKLQKDECYELLINLEHTDMNADKVRKTVSSNRYILDGEIYAYNPSEFDEPNINIESDLLQKVFSNGQLCFYQKDAGMYVYQYEGQLYWIANKDFIFDESGLTYIPCHLYTSEINKLPAEATQYKYSNHDFTFEKLEYTKENTAP